MERLVAEEMRRRRLGVALVAFVCLAGGAARADSPFLLPNAFAPVDRDHVTILAAFSDRLFAPEHAMRATDFHILGPDGRVPLTPTYFRDVTVLEAPVPRPGLYRVSSGLRTGRTAKAYLANREWVFPEPGEPVPPGVTPVDMQSLTLADVYLTRGEGSGGVMPPHGIGLELRPLSAMGRQRVGEAATFEALFDGRPIAGLAVELLHADAPDGKPPLRSTSDAKGQITLKPDRPGAQVVLARHRVGPATPGGPHRSYSYSLTLSVAAKPSD